MRKPNKHELQEEVSRLSSMNNKMHNRNNNLNYQKEICRMVTDGTMDGTDYYMMIYYFVREMHQKGGAA